MPDWVAVILLGLIEGVTEFMPVSSTGHLLIAENAHWTPRQTDLFNVVIQSGAVLAVLLVFTKRLKQLLFQWRAKETQNFLFKLGGAFLLTAAGGMVMKKLHFKLPAESAPVAWATLIGGVVILALERWLRGRPHTPDISWPVATMVGLAQLVAAVFPGTSRSGATILMAMAWGVGRPAATEFSFLLGIPTLLAAGALQIYSALKNPPVGGEEWGMVLLGTLVASLAAFAVVKWLLRFVQTHTFAGFGWYRIALGVVILLFVR